MCKTLKKKKKTVVVFLVIYLKQDVNELLIWLHDLKKQKSDAHLSTILHVIKAKLNAVTISNSGEIGCNNEMH